MLSACPNINMQEGELSFALAASMADGTLLFFQVRSCSILSSICNKQDARPFWWGCQLKRCIAPWQSSKSQEWRMRMLRGHLKHNAFHGLHACLGTTANFDIFVECTLQAQLLHMLTLGRPKGLSFQATGPFHQHSPCECAQL